MHDVAERDRDRTDHHKQEHKVRPILQRMQGKRSLGCDGREVHKRGRTKHEAPRHGAFEKFGQHQRLRCGIIAAPAAVGASVTPFVPLAVPSSLPV
jgi:hypothetical protein